MSVSKIVAAAASGAGGGAGLDVDEVFSTFLYTGTGATHTINNGIDLSGEGGLVWTKARNASYDHWLFDTARGAEKELNTNNTGGQGTTSGALQQFNSNGYQLGYSGGGYAELNQGLNYVSWTFRQAPKFFDVVTYTGNATARTIAHNLGSTPGMIILKKTSGTGPWYVFHRSSTDTDGKIGLQLNETDAQGDFGNTHWDVSEMSSTHFGLGNMGNMNGSGNTYVAYLFAHNNNDGGFGPDSDQDIIKCGSYTGNGSATGPEINLGFEPQWLLVKNATDSGNSWGLLDVMRGLPVGSNESYLFAQANWSEDSSVGNYIEPTSTGFRVVNSGNFLNKSGSTIIYMAIRRGPLNVPDDATKVFESDAYAGNQTANRDVTGNTDVLADLVLINDRQGQSSGWSGYAHYIFDRLRGVGTGSLATSNANAEVSGWSNYLAFDGPTAKGGWGLYGGNSGSTYFNKTGSDYVAHRWKRAPSYFDVVAYSGTGSARTVSHNLGAVPEMIWIKDRSSSNGFDWMVYHSGIGATKFLRLNTTHAETTSNNRWNDTEPAANVFTVGDSNRLNLSGEDYIAYLFATVAGVSKVGSYTGTGSALNIDCGFSSGARFVLIKRYDSSGYDWFIWDSVRGIVSGDDKRLSLNTTNAEVTQDNIDPLSSGFTISTTINGVNQSGGSYIFYAIA